jgi:hypothetical protein
MPAGADAASDPQIAEAMRSLIANDPEIQAVIRGVWGDTPVGQRPSDTPNALEGANHQASQQIAQILKRKGIDLPDRTFINPRSGALEGHRGWSGLNGIQKAAIIAAAAAATGGGLAAAGAFGAGGGAGAGAGASAASGAGAALPGGVIAPGVTAGLGGMGAAGAAAGGGGLLGTLGTIGKLGSLATGAATNLRAGRQEDAVLNLQQDRAKADIYGTQQNAVFNRANQELQQKQFGMTTAPTRARQAALGDILANIQNVKVTPPPGIRMGEVSGGLSPALLGPNARSAGSELSRQALLKLMDGSDTKFSDMPLLTPPPIQSTPQASKSENLLGILGTLGGLAGGVNEVMRRR